MPAPYRITAVCLGNICRSPMAEVVLRERVAIVGASDRIVVDSAGTGDWHIGHGMDDRAFATLSGRGYASAHVARQIDDELLAAADLVLAMDHRNLADLRRMAERSDASAEIRMMRSFDPELAGIPDGDPRLDVPDPYYDGPQQFGEVLEMLERAAAGAIEYASAAAR